MSSKDKQNGQGLPIKNAMFYVVGIDASVSGTGIVVINDDGDVMHQEVVGYSLKRGCNVEKKTIRDIDITKRILSVINEFKLNGILPYLGFEDFAYKKGTAAYDLGGLQHVIKAFVWQKWKMGWMEISNSSARKNVVGRGNATKEQIAKFITGKGMTIYNHNARDAWVIAEHIRMLILKTKGLKGD